MDLTLQNDDLIEQKLDNAKLELEVLRAREATALAEASAMNAATALAVARKRASIADLGAAPSAQEREQMALAEIAALSLEMFLFSKQQGFDY
jgi:hypothetical protein